ncbi:MAG: hypothetical protein AB1498_12945 [bacterium]
MKTKQNIPEFIAPCLWSYNIKKLGTQEDKELIITQVLNYGDEKRIKWLYSVYTEKDIKEVVSHPRRGLWFDRVLNFWEKMLDIRIPKKIRQKAIFNINPAFTQNK